MKEETMDAIRFSIAIYKISIGINIAIETFNKELNKAELPEDIKKIIQECFALGLASAMCLELRESLTCR